MMSPSRVCKHNGIKFEFISNAQRRDFAMGDCIKRGSLLVQIPDPETARALIKCAGENDDVKYWTGLNVCPNDRFGWTRRDCTLTKDQLFFRMPDPGSSGPISNVCTGLTFNPKQFFSGGEVQPMGGRDPCHDRYHYICQSDDVIEEESVATTTIELVTTPTVQMTPSGVYNITTGMSRSLTMLGDDVDGDVTSSADQGSNLLPYIYVGAFILLLIIVAILSVFYRRRQRSGKMKGGGGNVMELEAVTSKEVADGSNEERNVYSALTDIPATSHTNATYSNLPALPVCHPSSTDDNLDGYDGYLAPITVKPTSSHQPPHQDNNFAGYVTPMEINQQPIQQMESEYEIMRSPAHSTSPYEYARDVYEN